jgi:hypothetical protein
MLHYHVWFNLKGGVPEARGLATVERFLRSLSVADEAAAFQMLRNEGGPPRSKLPRYHALIQFEDDIQLANAMKRQTERGIHAGLHGEVIDVVSDFHVEIFSIVEDSALDPMTGIHACEI